MNSTTRFPVAFEIEKIGVPHDYAYVDISDGDKTPIEGDFRGTVYKLTFRKLFGKRCFQIDLKRPLRTTGQCVLYGIFQGQQCVYIGATRNLEQRKRPHLKRFGKDCEVRVLFTGSFEEVQKRETVEIDRYCTLDHRLQNRKFSSGFHDVHRARPLASIILLPHFAHLFPPPYDPTRDPANY